jgi:RNase P protein component
MKTRSLARQKEFRQVYEDGKKFVGRYSVIYLLPSPDAAKAVVASRKIGGAVQRNRAKRVLREALRAVIYNNNQLARQLAAAVMPTDSNEPDNRTECWIVVVARRAILDVGIKETTTELQQMLSGLTNDQTQQ